MRSIASNEKIKTNYKILTISIILIMIADEIIIENQSQEIQKFLIEKLTENSITKIYNKTILITLTIILYLLLTIISISKIVKIHEGPLRSKTYE